VSAHVQIREYVPADLDAIMALAPRLTEGKAPWRDDEAWLAAVRGWISGAAQSAAAPDNAVFVAVDGAVDGDGDGDGDKIVGVVHVAERTHFTGQVDAYVGELVTAAGQERRGIARALMHAAEEWGAARGLDYLTLETGVLNYPARAFYLAMGYLEEDLKLTKQIRGHQDVRRPDLAVPHAADLPQHRKLAAELFNGTWTLLEKQDRTTADDARMIHMAHASAYHWLQVGTPLNFARSHWLCSRVYSVLGRPEPALYHARLAHDICAEQGIGDFDLAYAYEALARAHAVGGNRSESDVWRDRARAATVGITDAEDRELLLSDLAEIPS
jgi:ribosomal protein S18 acetylase RimI-like enzyme